jgi:hypothetical protein
MTPSDLIAAILAQREQWVDIEPGKRLRVRRPPEAQIGQWRHGIDVERVSGCVVGWEGFTEADLLGASIGSDSAVPFDQALCSEVLRDRIEWAGIVSEALVSAITKHIEAREAARKNLRPS